MLEECRLALRLRAVLLERPPEWLAPVVEGIERLAKRRGLTFDPTLAPGIWMRPARPRPAEVVGNLLDNALRWADHLAILGELVTLYGFSPILERAELDGLVNRG